MSEEAFIKIRRRFGRQRRSSGCIGFSSFEGSAQNKQFAPCVNRTEDKVRHTAIATP